MLEVPAEPVAAPLTEALPGVFTPGPARHLAPIDATWLSVAPDGVLGIAAAFPSQQGLYAFRLGDPAGTWAPWAVTGTHVRDFWLVEDRTRLVTVSFRPDGKRDSDRIDVVPIVDGEPQLAASFRVAPDTRAIQNEVWDERAHRFGYWDIDQRAARRVPLEPLASAEAWPEGRNADRLWNPLHAATDAVSVLRTGYRGVDVYDEAGRPRPLLQCDSEHLCSFLAFVPTRREFAFAVSRGGDAGGDLYVAPY